MPFWTCAKCGGREEFQFSLGKPWDKHKCRPSVMDTPIFRTGDPEEEERTRLPPGAHYPKGDKSTLWGFV